MSNQYYDSDDEASEAQGRIDEILSGGSAASNVEQGPSDPLGGESGAGSRLRSRSARASLGVDSDAQRQSTPGGSQIRTGSARGRQALAVIGGILALGVLAVVVLFLLTGLSSGGITIPFLSPPTATLTLTPSPTPTPTVPPWNPPLLACLAPQSTVGCLDYCNNVENVTECSNAKQAIEDQGADFIAWLKCVSPQPGPNVGDPRKCFEDAYRLNHP